MVMISLSASPACGPRFLAGCASWLSSRASQCGPKAWQKSSNWQKSSTSRSNMDASPHLMAPTQEEEFKGDKRLASPQTRNSGYIRHLKMTRIPMPDPKATKPLYVVPGGSVAVTDAPVLECLRELGHDWRM